MNILLINPGRRNYLVKYYLDLSRKYNLKIFMIDPNKNIPSNKVSYKINMFICPPCKKKEKFKNFLRKFVKKKKIKTIFPLSENELKIIADEKKYYKKLKVNIISSDRRVIDICQNKILASKFLNRIGVNTPKIISFSKIKKNLPVIMKKTNGNSSIGQLILENKNFIPLKSHKNYFFQKYLKYQEFGMDILNDLEGNFLHCTVRKKISIRAGDTDSAKIINSKKFLKLAKLISKKLKHIGNLDVDFLYNKKKSFVLDLNPRFGGGYPFTHKYGYNYIEALLKLISKKKRLMFKKYNNKNNIFSKGITIESH